LLCPLRYYYRVFTILKKRVMFSWAVLTQRLARQATSTRRVVVGTYCRPSWLSTCAIDENNKQHPGHANSSLSSSTLNRDFAMVQYSMSLLLDSIFSEGLLFLKRTFQPSIIRKRRKTGFLTRQKTVGGRKILNRRKHKGRKRLGGC